MKSARSILTILVSAIAISYVLTGNSDSCTESVNGYLDGLDTLVNLNGSALSELKKQQAKTEYLRIQTMRGSKTDCEVRKTIPVFVAADQAAEKAMRVLESQN